MQREKMGEGECSNCSPRIYMRIHARPSVRVRENELHQLANNRARTYDEDRRRCNCARNERTTERGESH